MLKPLDTILYRVPQFPVNAKLVDCWEQLKSSISHASEDLYQIIKDLEFDDIKNQSPSLQFTIEKYFNRSRFRATPYGTFASVGTIRQLTGEDSQITIQAQTKLHAFPDWKENIKFKDLWKTKSAESLVLQSNGTFYPVGEIVRYIFRNEEGFELTEINAEPDILFMLYYCSNNASYESLEQVMANKGYSSADLQYIVGELIENQLLFTQYHPNIIGDDYFRRLGLEETNKHKTYGLNESTVISGELNSSKGEELVEMINFIVSHFSTENSNSNLERFKESFYGRYEHEWKPLMEALDPETGIGYGGMEGTLKCSELMNAIIEHKSDTQNQEPNSFKRLVQSFHKNTSNTKQVIQLEKLNLKKSVKKVIPFPNTFNVILEPHNGFSVIEQIGGGSPSGNSIIGRFSLINSTFWETCKDIGNIEQAANPDVLFVDIAYCGEPSVDNVNRRRSIYNYQLSICNFDLSKNILSLNDIYVNVVEDEVVLYSKSLGKRIIPRISTAYNYTRSDMAVFRILCDIQQQGLHNSILPDFDSYFPNAEFIPRVQFKNFILSRKKWIIHLDSSNDDITKLNSCFQNWNLPDFIKVGFADQTLLLQWRNLQDLALLLSILKVNKTLVLQEGFVSDTALFKDVNGNPFISELVYTLTHSEELYRDVKFHIEDSSVTRMFAIGSDWLYYQIDCHPSMMDLLLTLIGEKVIDKYDHKIEQWFFIRYKDATDHIRIRIKVKKGNLEIIQVKFHEAVIAYLEDGRIKDLRLATYKREIERYGADLIEKIEKHFSVDSNLILSILMLHFDELERYGVVLYLMDIVLNEAFTDAERLTILLMLKDSHNTEHKMEGKLFKVLNKSFKEFNPFNNTDFEVTLQLQLSYLAQSFIGILESVQGERKVQLFADLFHMHINRMFTAFQREHEMIIYNYLLKLYAKMKFVASAHEDQTQQDPSVLIFRER